MTPTARAWRVAKGVVLAMVCWALLPLLLTEVALRSYDRWQAFKLSRGFASGSSYDLPMLGYRDHPVGGDRKPGELRILSLGDSFAHSIVWPDYTYAAVLERELADRLATPVRVVNLGRPATSFHHYLDELEFWSQRLEFDAVLVNVYAGNDFREASRSLGGGVGGEPQDIAALFRPNVPRRKTLRMADYLTAVTARFGQVILSEEELYVGRFAFHEEKYLEIMSRQLDAYRWDRVSDFSQGFVLLEELLRQLERWEEAEKKTFVAVSPPHAAVSDEIAERALRASGQGSAQLDHQLPLQILETAARRVGYRGEILDLQPILRRSTREGREPYYSTNTHWSVDGNSIVGTFLAEDLEQGFSAARSRPSDRPIDLVVDALFPRLPGTEEAAESSAIVDEVSLSRRFFRRRALDRHLAAQGLSTSRLILGALEAIRNLNGRAHAAGLAFREDERGEPLEVLVFSDGKLIARGRPAINATDRRTRFLLPLERGCSEATGPGRLWALGIDRSSYAWLRVAKGLRC